MDLWLCETCGELCFEMFTMSLSFQSFLFRSTMQEKKMKKLACHIFETERGISV
jgi:hypothetical protein